MARRVTKQEKPFNPIEAALVQNVALRSPSGPLALVETATRVEEVEEEPEPDDESLDPEVAPVSPPASLVKSLPLSTSEAQERESPPDAGQPTKGKRRSSPARMKRVVLSAEDQRFLEELCYQLSQDLDAPVKLANVLRAAVILLRHSRQQARKHAKRVGGLARPPNSDPAALAVFEHRLAKLVETGLRETQPLE